MLEHNACLKMCELLARDAVDLPIVGPVTRVDRGPKPDGFDMSRVIARHECGTSACVLGWANWFASQGEPVKEIDFNYAWVYSTAWAGFGVQQALHRMYFEIAYGAPDDATYYLALRDWASFVSLYPFETCKADAYAHASREVSQG